MALLHSLSKVLLVCIYDTHDMLFTNDMVREFFLPCAELRRVLIFERGQVTKVFIELPTPELALFVRSNFNKTRWGSTHCRIHIYFSSLAEIDLRHELSHGCEYPHFLASDRGFQTFDQQTNSAFECDYARYQTREGTQAKPSLAAENENVQDYLQLKIRSDIIQNILSEDDSPCSSEAGLGSPSADSPMSRWFSPNSSPRSPQIALAERCPVTLRFSYVTEPSSVHVYNLFSNYGNITRVQFKKNSVFVSFTNSMFAESAREQLQGLTLFGNILRLQYARKQQAEQVLEEQAVFKFGPESYRFTQKKSIAVNPPTNTLHISNIKREMCSEDKLKQFFGAVVPVNKVVILAQSKQKNMALVKFRNLADSISALSTFHGHMVNGRQVQLSFSKSKI